MRKDGIITHNQLRKANDNSPPSSRVSERPPKNAEPQILKKIITRNQRKTKPIKNNQTALGSSCFIINKLDLSEKVDQLFTIIIARVFKIFLSKTVSLNP